jgi:Ankyrin repeats (many copies)
MGHGISCARSSDELEFFRALQSGDLDAVRLALSLDRNLVHRSTPYGRVSPLHIAAANGHLEVRVEIPFSRLMCFEILYFS